MSAFGYSAYKLLSLFAFPLGFALLALVGCIVALLVKRRRTALVLLVGATCWLWFWSMPVVSNALRASLETPFPFRPATDFPNAEVIVVLGGGVQGTALGSRAMPHLGKGADREWFAADLYHAGKAPLLLLTSGQVMGEEIGPGADGMATFLRALGVPGGAIILEPLARNTLENGRFVQKQLAARGVERILLVTSAYHMRRALRVFERTKLHIVPAPTDHAVIRADFDIQQFLPGVGGLSDSTDAIKEYLGIWTLELQQRLQG